MLNLITGGAGFIGTNLIKELLERGESVISIDNLSAAASWKAELYQSNANYEFIKADIVSNLQSVLTSSSLLTKQGKIERIYNLACPASPPRYMKLSLETIQANSIGLMNVLDLAKEHGSRVLQASTSEVYGDPHVHPQPETYWGNVNSIGPRSCYDESKRLAETICYEYQRLFGLDIRLVRIFNTYGPYMDPEDGRVITNFIRQALAGEPITIYGQGEQTRSFQYVSDLVQGFLAFMDLPQVEFGPLNLGNPEEFTIKQLAELILEVIPTQSKIVFQPAWQDDPKQRRPDISKAQTLLGWNPKVKLAEGLASTIAYYRELS